MSIEGRRSIHREEQKFKSDSNKTTPIRRASGKSVADKTPFIHGSQEDLNEEISFEEELSASTSFQNSNIGNNIESNIPSPRVRRSNQNVSRVRTDSPIQRKVSKTNVQKKASPVPQENYSSVLLKICVVCLVSALCLGFVNFSNLRKSVYVCSFNDLRDRYSNESALIWEYLKSDIEDILNERTNKPSVTLFLHFGGTTAKKLIRDIAKTASNCIDSSLEPVEFGSSDFTSGAAANDYGVIIDKYKKTTKEGNVVMIANLNEIPAEAARALHAICDRESPIFRKVVILLSLSTNLNEGRPIDIAQNALFDLWEGKIMENELGPLMTRVTDEVLLLQSK